MLDQVLREFRLQAEVYHNAKVCGDWIIHEGDIGQTCFHLPTEGGCQLTLPGQEPIILNTGDLAIFPREIPHSMQPLVNTEGEQRHLSFSEAPASGTGMLCGRILFQHRGFDQILNALPEVFYIPRSQSRSWLEPILALMLDESYRSAANVRHSSPNIVIDRGSELLFILALRHFVEHNPDQVGALALYATPKLAAAVQAIHQQPEHKWSVETLAQQAGMSRTAFSNHFKAVSGWTPMQYLTWWRMQLAWSQLQQGEPVSRVAEAIGYQSESAFSRAFQNQFGISAGKVRARNGTEAK